MKNAFDYILPIVAALLLAALPLLTYKIGFRNGRERPVERVIHDTSIVYRIDTISVSTPVYVAIKTIDTMWVRIPVSEGRDSLALPREQAHYKDSTYEAWVSGYKPRLDSLNVYKNTEYITVTNTVYQKDRRRWGVGVHGGVGLSAGGVTPYVGVGISYNIIRW